MNGKRILTLVFGIYLLGSGLYGLIMFFITIPVIRSLFSAPLFVLFALSFCSFSIYCGILFLRVDLLRAFNYSKICLGIQILQLKIFGFWFAAALGLYVATGFTDTPDFVFRFSRAIVTGEIQLSYQKDSEIEVLVNIIPILLLLILYRFEEVISPNLP